MFCARFGAAFCWFNIEFCWSTYLRPLSHLSLLGFVTFVFFTLRGQLFLIFRCHHFFFINSCAFSYYLSFLLPDEACGRNVVSSTVCCSFVFFSLNFYTSILFVLHNFRNSSLFRTSVQPLSSFLRASFLPSSASTLPSFEAPTFVRFLTFLYWVLSLSYFPHFAVSYFSYFAVTFFSS